MAKGSLSHSDLKQRKLRDVLPQPHTFYTEEEGVQSERVILIFPVSKNKVTSWGLILGSGGLCPNLPYTQPFPDGRPHELYSAPLCSAVGSPQECSEAPTASSQIFHYPCHLLCPQPSRVSIKVQPPLRPPPHLPSPVESIHIPSSPLDHPL